MNCQICGGPFFDGPGLADSLMTVEVIPYGKGRAAAVELRVHRRHRYETIAAVAPVPTHRYETIAAVAPVPTKTSGSTWDVGTRNVVQAVSDQDLLRMVEEAHR